MYATTLYLEAATNFNISLGYDVLIKANFVDDDDFSLSYKGYNKTGPVNLLPKIVVSTEIGVVAGIINS